MMQCWPYRYCSTVTACLSLKTDPQLCFVIISITRRKFKFKILLQQSHVISCVAFVYAFRLRRFYFRFLWHDIVYAAILYVTFSIKARIKGCEKNTQIIISYSFINVMKSDLQRLKITYCSVMFMRFYSCKLFHQPTYRPMHWEGAQLVRRIGAQRSLGAHSSFRSLSSTLPLPRVAAMPLCLACVALLTPGQDSVDAGRSPPFWATIVWDGQASNLQEGPHCRPAELAVEVLAWIGAVEMAYCGCQNRLGQNIIYFISAYN